MGAKIAETGLQRGSISHPAWLPGRSPQFVATIVVNLLAFSFGAVCGWPSIGNPRLSDLGVSEEALSWVASIVMPAGLVGAAVFGPLTERCGRRVSALLVAVPMVAGWSLLIIPEFWFDANAEIIAVANMTVDAVMNHTVGNGTAAVVEELVNSNVDLVLWVTLVARCLLGVGMGGVLIVCPMYVGEVVEDSLRGQLGSYMALFINGGVLYVYVVGAQVSWGILSFLCLIFPAAFLVLFAFLPETPMFMLSRGDDRGALRSFMWLRDPRCGDVDYELQALRETLKRGEHDVPAESDNVGPRDLVATRGVRHGLIIVLGLLVLQQLSGITAIINYAASIFEMAGSTLDPNAAAIVVGAVQLAGSVAACGLADNLGRLPLLYASYGGMVASLSLLGACFKWPGVFPGWLPVTCLSVYMFVYAVGSGPIPFLLLVEVFPSRLRALASQAGLGLLLTLAFLVAKFFSTLADALGSAGCFWTFGACSALGVVFIRVFIPETKGRAVEDIVAELEGGQAREKNRKTDMA